MTIAPFILFGLLAATSLAGPARSAAVCDGAVSDPVRDRSIPVRVRMPETAQLSNGGRVPVILFSHGLGGSVEAGTLFARDWARAGFLVVHVQHPGSDQSVWKGQRGGRGKLMAAAGPQQLRDRIADMGRVADAVGNGLGIGACDLARGDSARLAAAGHSFGAHTVLALAGQNFGPIGAGGRDLRFLAVAALSPMAPRTDPGLAPAAFGGLRVPVLTATGSADGSPLAKDKSLDQVVAARTAVFSALPPSRTGQGSVGLWLDGATHADFGGNAGPARPADARVAAITSAATTAFFRAHLAGDGRPDLAPARKRLGPDDRIETK
jgi:dienelactone hydrolase